MAQTSNRQELLKQLEIYYFAVRPRLNSVILR